MPHTADYSDMTNDRRVVACLRGLWDTVDTTDKCPQLLVKLCARGHKNAAYELLCRGWDKDAITQCGNTPMLAACQHGRRDVAEMLMDQGANVSLTLKGRTALSVSVSNGADEVLAMLMNSGISWSCEHIGQAVCMAAKKRSMKSLRILLESGADPNHRHEGRIPLFDSVIIGNVEAVRLLLSAGANANTLYRDVNSFDIAVRYERTEIVTLILESGFDVNYRMLNGRRKTPGMISVTRSTPASLEIFEKILLSGADIHKKNDRGDDMFTTASYYNNHIAMSRMLEMGADVNTELSNGTTILYRVLMSAPLSKKHYETITILLKHGAHTGDRHVFPQAMSRLYKAYCDIMSQQKREISVLKTNHNDRVVQRGHLLESIDKLKDESGVSVFPEDLALRDPDEAVEMITWNPIIIQESVEQTISGKGGGYNGAMEW